ncbi:peptidyl-alpha-hydroxyglycine alpha-amidating lyase family protein [Sandarakinorhabdus rubra]|uniref:peptidyl-alpha-hydroxyglycine alpha-amidating lyase family protein n=1 Tax=Sandarakinorhabdus rubra TaxID=2672568 RepID=UPI0013DD4D95|nr:peptidyl-alpha-hydroxyglycine alpha-amidating lyase family protein [Sandarakinorhabdus rubra]
MNRLIAAVSLLLAGTATLAQQAAAPSQPQRPVWTVDTLPKPAPLTAETNKQPNPYATDIGFFKLPPGRVMGSTSAVGVDSKGHIWITDRCGANSCAGSPLDPIMEFDEKGNFIKAFGGGLTVFPHGFYIDAKDNIWLTDARASGGKGATVMKFSPDGKLLMTLGKPGVQGKGTDVFTEPNAVIVAKNGTIFVADGHEADRGLARILKFDRNGKFLMQWGQPGKGQGDLEVPHALAMDSKGLLYVGDRWNNRVQVYTQNGKLLNSWTQFGRPSGLFIDRNDILYSADSESRRPVGYGYNPGWQRGIRIGSVKDGKVTAFIPDPEPEPDKYATSDAEGITVDRNGVIYGAQVKERLVARHVRVK